MDASYSDTSDDALRLAGLSLNDKGKSDGVDTVEYCERCLELGITEQDLDRYTRPSDMRKFSDGVTQRVFFDEEYPVSKECRPCELLKKSTFNFEVIPSRVYGQGLTEEQANLLLSQHFSMDQEHENAWRFRYRLICN